MSTAQNNLAHLLAQSKNQVIEKLSGISSKRIAMYPPSEAASAEAMTRVA